MTMMLLMLVFTSACGDDDEPNSKSFSSSEKSALEALSGTWTSESGNTITFSPWSAPKTVNCSVTLGADLDKYTSKTFHGEMNRSNGVTATYYYFVVNPSSKKITANGQAKGGGYTPDESYALTYTYKLENSNKTLTLTSGSTSTTYTK